MIPRGRVALVVDDPAVAHMYLPLAAFGDAWIMRDQEQGCAVPRLMLEQAIDHQAAGGGVEISRRLVGEEQLWPGDKGAGDRHALLFAPRKLPGIMSQAMIEADRREPMSRDLERIAAATELERESDVFKCRHRRDQVKRLEHDTDAFAAKAGQRVFVERAEVVSADPYLSAAGPLQPAYDHHQRRFSRAR